jgi:exodeoxyribonuclease VII large subunit
LKTYSLYELNEFLRRVVALNFTEAIWITAEVGQINESRGHYFLSLLEKEESDIVAEMSGVIWASDFRRIKRNLGNDTEGVLSEGVEIRLKGRLDFHERYGIKIIIEEIDPAYTLGKLEIERRKIIAELSKDGLTERQKRLKLPSVVQRIAVISSETAAGYADFQNHLVDNDYGYWFEYELFQTAMQGSLVEKTLLQSLDAIRKRKAEFDCVIIIRGGGSRLDLVAFDNPSVCKAVARFPLPILTGIGHEIDAAVVDLVAFQSLKTPTAVADFLIAHNLKFEAQLLEWGNELKIAVQNRLITEGGELARLQDFLSVQTRFLLRHQSQILSVFENKVQTLPTQILKLENMKLDNTLKIIDLLSVDSTLKRGFSITRRVKDGSLVTSEVEKGENIETILRGGKIQSTVV